MKSYWKIEAANIFLIPGITILIVRFRYQENIGLPLILSMIATAWLLVIGAIALRMMYETAVGDDGFEKLWIGRLYYAKFLSILVVVAALAGTVWELFQSYPGLTASAVACIVLTAGAAAEYINYYHVQLQHFDNRADFKRLLAGKGFRKSHLARAIARWKTAAQKD